MPRLSVPLSSADVSSCCLLHSLEMSIGDLRTAIPKLKKPIQKPQSWKRHSRKFGNGWTSVEKLSFSVTNITAGWVINADREVRWGTGTKGIVQVTRVQVFTSKGIRGAIRSYRATIWQSKLQIPMTYDITFWLILPLICPFSNS